MLRDLYRALPVQARLILGCALIVYPGRFAAGHLAVIIAGCCALLAVACAAVLWRRRRSRRVTSGATHTGPI